MSRTTRTRIVNATIATLLLVTSAGIAHAAPKKITQARALAGGITPGDAPGFPVTISRPGSYILQTNLTLPSTTGTIGIEVLAESVDINLNGFTIRGPKVCPDEDSTPCPPGIEDTSYHLIKGGDNVTVRNGTARGSGGNGITLGAHATIERVNILWNGLFGLVAGKGSHVRDSRVAQNGYGVVAGPDCRVRGNVVRANTFSALELSSTNCGYADNTIACSGFSCVFNGIDLGGNICNGSTTPGPLCP